MHPRIVSRSRSGLLLDELGVGDRRSHDKRCGPDRSGRGVLIADQRPPFLVGEPRQIVRPPELVVRVDLSDGQLETTVAERDNHVDLVDPAGAELEMGERGREHIGHERRSLGPVGDGETVLIELDLARGDPEVLQLRADVEQASVLGVVGRRPIELARRDPTQPVGQLDQRGEQVLGLVGEQITRFEPVPQELCRRRDPTEGDRVGLHPVAGNERRRLGTVSLACRSLLGVEHGVVLQLRVRGESGL